MGLHKKVSKLSKSELVELVIDLIDGDEDVEKKVEFKLFTPNDEVKASKELIRKYINENKRRGFISWRNVHAALQGAEIVLDKGRDKIVIGEEETAIRLGVTVHSIVVDMLQYADDSGGEIGYLINGSVTLLKDASSKLLLSADYHVQDNMFEFILKEALHKRYEGWNEMRYNLLDVCTIFSARASSRIKLEETLDQLIVQVSAISSMSSDYDKQMIKQLQLKILERNGESERAEQLIRENLDFDEFREMAIEKEIMDGNYESALKMCEDGEKINQNYPGLVQKWKQYRLQIYERLEDVEKQKEILLDFIYDNEYEAYSKLNSLYSPEEWRGVVENIFSELESKSGYLPHVYEYIAKTENRSDKILNYCEQSPMTIVELYPYLLDDYEDRVEELFTNYIKSEAEQASNRNEYRNICQKLTTYKKALGESAFSRFVDELKETYHRKPAFMNELEKVEERVE